MAGEENRRRRRHRCTKAALGAALVCGWIVGGSLISSASSAQTTPAPASVDELRVLDTSAAILPPATRSYADNVVIIAEPDYS